MNKATNVKMTLIAQAALNAYQTNKTGGPDKVLNETRRTQEAYRLQISTRPGWAKFIRRNSNGR